MISVIPAIDVMDGRCVRLARGDFARRTTYDLSPVQAAARYVEAGFRTLHVVDLDGARAGRARQLGVLEAIVAETGADVQFGGGVQSDDDVRAVLDAGAARVVAGSAAVRDRARVLEWLARYGAERVVIAADSLDGRVRVDAWRQGTDLDVIDLLSDYRRAGALWALCTDVARDGRMSGPSVGLYREIRSRVPRLRVIASGGVRSRADIEALDDAGADAVVVGKALLEGAIDPTDLGDFAC